MNTIRMQQTDVTPRIRQLKARPQHIESERHLQIINNFGLILLHKTTIDEIVWLVAKSVIAHMGFVHCVLYLKDETGTILIQKAAHGIKNPSHQEILNPITINVGEGIVGAVAETGIPEIINDTRKDDRYIVDNKSRLSEIAVPIIFDNKIIGVIDSEHPETNAFNEDDLITLSTIASMSSIKIVHAQALLDLQNHKANLESQVKERTQQLTQTIVKLEKSNKDLEIFAYAASHDMQEPLRTVVSYLQLLRINEEKTLSGTSLEFLDYAVDGSKRMKRLLDGLLEYSLLKNSNDVHQAVNLEDTLILVKADLHTTITENNAIIIYENLPTIFGNKTQVRQLFQNIISNAIKFQKPGRQPKVEITAEEKDDFQQLTIKDNGLGIAPAFHEKVFGLFQRLNATRDYKGSGIGLSLCKRIIEYHNGEISLRSGIGKGTSFIFTLPKLN